MNDQWNNSIKFSVAYLVSLLVLTSATVVIGKFVDSQFPDVSLIDFFQQFSSQAVSPIISILIVATSPQFWWVAASAISFLLPLISDLGSSTKRMESEKGVWSLVSIGSVLGAVINFGVTVGIYVTTVRPDLDFDSQFSVVAFAISPSLAASLAFAFVLHHTLLRKPDKL